MTAATTAAMRSGRLRPPALPSLRWPGLIAANDPIGAPARRRGGSHRLLAPSPPKLDWEMLFVEALRVAFVLVGVLIGVLLTGGGHHSADERFVGAAIGALLGYVAGGLVGRLLQRGMGAATTRLSDVP